MPAQSRCALGVLNCLLLAVAIPLSAQPPKPSSSQKVVKLISTSEDARFGGFGRGFGRGGFGGGGGGRGGAEDPNAPAYIVVTTPEGGKPVRLNVTAEFRRRLASIAQEKGELVNITLTGESVSSVTRFEGPKELKNPHTYTFEGLVEKTTGAASRPVVKLSRFGTTIEALIPTRPGLDGMQPQPDEALIGRIRNFSNGQVVQAEFVANSSAATKNLPVLVDIDVPRPPRGGDFVKSAMHKDPAGKTIPAIVIETEGTEQTFLLPAASATAPNPAAAAISALRNKLKPGYGVQFSASVATGSQPATLRDLRIEGGVSPSGEKSLHVRSGYVRVDLFNNPFSRDADKTDVAYRPGIDRDEDEELSRGVSKALASDSEIARLKLTPEQVKFLTGAADSIGRRRDEKPTAAEKAQWVNAYHAWFNSSNESARLRIEQEMLFAAQELSSRWRKDFQDGIFLIRSTLNSEQLPLVKELGKELGK